MLVAGVETRLSKVGAVHLRQQMHNGLGSFGEVVVEGGAVHPHHIPQAYDAAFHSACNKLQLHL